MQTNTAIGHHYTTIRMTQMQNTTTTSHHLTLIQGGYDQNTKTNKKQNEETVG